MPLSLKNLKIGSKYRITNYSDEIEFFVIDTIEEGDYLCKDLHTLETFNLKSIIEFGVSNDYGLDEIE